MLGGGSLGAYECDVFKALAKHGIKFDIVAGTCIGAVYAGIVAGSKSGHPEKAISEKQKGQDKDNKIRYI